MSSQVNSGGADLEETSAEFARHSWIGLVETGWAGCKGLVCSLGGKVHLALLGWTRLGEQGRFPTT